MDFKTYDTALVTGLGATLLEGKKGYWVSVAGITDPVPCLFDVPEEWWASERLEKPQGDRVVPVVSVQRVDLVPDPSRFLPAFRGREVSTSEENTLNIQKDPAQPMTLLYEVQVASYSQLEMNSLLAHVLTRLPSAGYGTDLTVEGRSIPYHLNSVRNYAWNTGKQEGRIFRWGYTYAVEGWITTTACIKVPQVLQVDVTVTNGSDYTNEVSVTESS